MPSSADGRGWLRAKLSPASRASLKCVAAGFTVFPFSSCSSPAVSPVTRAGVVSLPLPSVPLGNAVLTLHQNVLPLQNRVGLVAGGFLDCVGLFLVCF